MTRLALALLLASCASQPSGNPGQLLPPLAAVPSPDDVPTVAPFVRVLHGKTSCLGWRGVNPLAVPDNSKGPRVGVEWRCLFTTAACPLPDPPSWPCWILSATRPLTTPIDFTSFGAVGCWMLTHPDSIVAVPQGSSTMFIREGGQITLRWTPTQDRLGHYQSFQLVTLCPVGFLSSPAVEITVGSQ